MSRRFWLGAAIFSALVAARNPGFWGYALGTPGALTLASIGSSQAFNAVSIFLAIVMAAAATAGGAAIRRLPPDSTLAYVEAFALGLGALGLAFLLYGLGSGYDPAALIVLVGIFALVGGLALNPREEIARLLRRPQPVPWPAHPAAPVLGALLAFCVWHVLCLALAPATEWDVLAYHLALPKLYLRAERIIAVPWLVHSHWPHLAEVLYGAPLALGSESGAAALHALACLGLAAAAWDWGRRRLDAASAGLGACLLAAQPLFLRFAGTAHSDGLMALFFFLGAASLWDWVGAGGTHRLVRAGVFAGLCASSKLPGLVLAAGLTLSLLWRGRRAPGAALRHAAVFFGAAMAVVSPWYLKTWAETGNPVWPFFSEFLGGNAGAEIIEAPYLASSRWMWPPEADLLTRYGAQFLLLPLAVLGTLARARLPESLRFMLFPLWLYLPFVIRQHEAWRFMWPFLPALCLSLAWWGRQAWSRAGAPRAAALAALALALWPGVSATQNNQLFAALGAGSAAAPGEPPRELYRAKAIPGYQALRAAARALGPQERMLLFREIRGYLLEADYVWGDPLNQGLIPYARIDGVSELRARLRALGITHVLVNAGLPLYGPSPGYYSPRVLSLMSGVLADSPAVLSQEGVVLHALR